MVILQVFKFGSKVKTKELSRVVSSPVEPTDVTGSLYSLQGPTAISSHPETKDEKKKSKAKLFRQRHLSTPSRLDIVKVGVSGLVEGKGASPNPHSQGLWRDQFGAEELAGLLLTPREIERQEIINELISTEKDYVSDLALINEVYIEPLYKNKYVDPVTVSAIFLNLPDLLTLHQFLLLALQRRMDDQMPVVKEISDVILEWIKELQIYTDYLVPQRRALAEYEHLMATNKRFSTFVRAQGALKECRGLDLQGYLVKPFQRLLKYPLLIKNLLEVSSSGTLDYINAIRCHHALEGLITRIQEAKFCQEHAPTLKAWQEKIPSAVKFRLSDPRRQLCCEGLLSLVKIEIVDTPSQHQRPSKGGSLKRDTLFLALFGDVLVHVPECNRRGLSKMQLLSSAHPTTIICKVMDIRNLPDSAQTGSRFWFMLITVDTNTTRLILEAQDEAQKQTWMEAFRLAIPTHTGS